MAEKDRTIRAISRYPSKNDTLRQTAVGFFNSKSTYKIYVTCMGVTRWCEGKIYKFSLPIKNPNKNMELSVTFLCANPYMRSFDDFGKNIAAITGMIAFPYLCNRTRQEHAPVGITGGIYNFMQKVTLNNDGDTEADCRVDITANGVVTNPQIKINGNMVRVLDVMNRGDEIEIDFTNNPPTVKKNGVNFIGHCDRTSAFDEMSLQIGDNTIEFDADDGANKMNVSVYYNKLYTAI